MLSTRPRCSLHGIRAAAREHGLGIGHELRVILVLRLDRESPSWVASRILRAEAEIREGALAREDSARYRSAKDLANGAAWVSQKSDLCTSGRETRNKINRDVFRAWGPSRKKVCTHVMQVRFDNFCSDARRRRRPTRSSRCAWWIWRRRLRPSWVRRWLRPSWNWRRFRSCRIRRSRLWRNRVRSRRVRGRLGWPRLGRPVWLGRTPVRLGLRRMGIGSWSWIGTNRA
jgi:hypothetical protein